MAKESIYLDYAGLQAYHARVKKLLDALEIKVNEAADERVEDAIDELENKMNDVHDSMVSSVIEEINEDFLEKQDAITIPEIESLFENEIQVVTPTEMFDAPSDPEKDYFVVGSSEGTEIPVSESKSIAAKTIRLENVIFKVKQ